MPKVEVLPSILAMDCAHLGDELRRLQKAGAEGWHVDVMDGHFVPNITMGPMWAEAVRRNSDKFMDVHLMVYSPYEMVERFVAAGADRITFHMEATEDIDETLNFIRKCGKQAGLAINPETSVELLEPYLAKIDLALIMTVHPGFGGQAFIEDTLPKVDYLAKLRDQHQLKQVSNSREPLLIQVDGGIDDHWGPQCRALGATSLVSGSFLVRASDPVKAMAYLSQ